MAFPDMKHRDSAIDDEGMKDPAWSAWTDLAAFTPVKDVLDDYAVRFQSFFHNLQISLFFLTASLFFFTFFRIVCRGLVVLLHSASGRCHMMSLLVSPVSTCPHDFCGCFNNFAFFKIQSY
jgi:hypothetical protein